MQPVKSVEVFGLAITMRGGKPYLGVWSCNLRDIIAALKHHLRRRFIIVTRAGLYSWLRLRAGSPVAHLLREKNIAFKALRNGYAAFTDREFEVLETKIRKVVRGGDFDFIDSVVRPPYNLFPGCHASQLKWSNLRPIIPSQLRTTFNWHMHDGYMSMVTVSNDQLLRHLTERLLSRIIDKALPKTTASAKQTAIAGFDDRFWKKFRTLLTASGVTCAKHDIKQSDKTIVLEAWAGYPEWSDRLPGDQNKKVQIKYSLSKSRWYLSMPRKEPFSYGKHQLYPFRH